MGTKQRPACFPANASMTALIAVLASFTFFLALFSRAEDGLRLARVKDGVVTLSSITKPEELSFDAPSHRQLTTDVELLDIVLLASVDGLFHALNRTTSRSIWSMDDHHLYARQRPPILAPLVRTDHEVDKEDEDTQELYIVEPQSGDIFVLPEDADRGKPLKRLPYTIPKLVELSPFSLKDPYRVFVGSKDTAIITLDLDTGEVLRTAGSGTGHDWLEIEDGRRKKRREIQIGRTGRFTRFMVTLRIDELIDYKIRVFSMDKLLQTLSFSSYGPNNVDAALQANWVRTPDDLYFQPSWDGTTYAFQTSKIEISGSKSESTAKYGVKYHQPIVAIFDVVSASSALSDKPHPICLLQPRAKLQELFPTKHAQLLGIKDKTFIGKIGDSLFAMGHLNYPLVNLAQVPVTLRIEGVKPERCNDLECYIGCRYTERDESQSRISRLLDSPEMLSAAHHGRRDVEEQTALPTQVEVAAAPTHSKPQQPQFNGHVTIDDNSRPDLTSARALNWTLVVPFVGGLLAIWLLLRKFIKVSARDDLIRPLQVSREESALPLIEQQQHSNNSTLQPSTSTSRLRELAPTPLLEKNEPVIMTLFNEKEELEEGSDKEDKDGDAAKRKGKRRRRGKRKAGKADENLPDTPGPEENLPTGTGTDSQGYVMVEDVRDKGKQPELGLPLPVQSSVASLVVSNKVLGTFF